jgi:hypothetical protein
MIFAAAHRARLLIDQLTAQLFNTGAAGQTLALQQFDGHFQRLLGGFMLSLQLQAAGDAFVTLFIGLLLL